MDVRGYRAMSDRLSELELNNVVLAVSDVAEWFALGLQLGLPNATLRLIAADPNIKGIKSQRLAMLSEWLKYDTAASWEKLAAALASIGENVAATNVRSQFMKVAPDQCTVALPDISEDEKICQEMKQNVLRAIKCKFASLLLDVRSAIECRQIKVSDVHQFMVASFQGECCIPEAPDLTKLFNIVTEAKLWRYDHYGPLRELAEKFLPDDDPTRKLVSKYRDQLSGFYTATKIIDFIDLSELDDSDADSEDRDATQPSLSPKELYRELQVTLKLDRKTNLSEISMSYVETLWKALVEEFKIPPLTTIIKKIVGGSLIITWLVPPQVSTVIAASYAKALRFYQQNNIVQIQLDGRTLYHEDWIVGDINNNLIEACRWGDVERATVLLERGAHVNHQDERGESALWRASSAGETECVKLLLKYGAQVDLPDESGNTALIEACQHGHVETAMELLDHGAIVDQQNIDGETALNLACYEGESGIVRLLLQAQAKPDFQESGLTALYWAAWRGDANIVQIMVDYGATVDLGRDVDGWTGLLRASYLGHTETMGVLLKAKADPNITDEDGESALHLAARRGKVEAATVLVKYGAAVDVRNKHGLTALDLARGGGEEAVCKVLEQYTKQEAELTQEQRESIYQRLLKMVERTFLKEQTKKKQEQQKKERRHQREERVGGQGQREKRSLWSRLGDVEIDPNKL